MAKRKCSKIHHRDSVPKSNEVHWTTPLNAFFEMITSGINISYRESVLVS